MKRIITIVLVVAAMVFVKMYSTPVFVEQMNEHIGITFATTHDCVIGWGTEPGSANYVEKRTRCSADAVQTVSNALYLSWYPTNNRWWNMTEAERIAESERLGCECVRPNKSTFACSLSASTHTIICAL